MKIVSLVLLALCAFAMVTNVVMAFNVQLPSKVTTLMAVGCNSNPGVEPAGDGAGGPPCPRGPRPP